MVVKIPDPIALKCLDGRVHRSGYFVYNLGISFTFEIVLDTNGGENHRLLPY